MVVIFVVKPYPPAPPRNSIFIISQGPYKFEPGTGTVLSTNQTYTFLFPSLHLWYLTFILFVIFISFSFRTVFAPYSLPVSYFSLESFQLKPILAPTFPPTVGWKYFVLTHGAVGYIRHAEISVTSQGKNVFFLRYQIQLISRASGICYEINQ